MSSEKSASSVFEASTVTASITSAPTISEATISAPTIPAPVKLLDDKRKLGALHNDPPHHTVLFKNKGTKKKLKKQQKETKK